MCETVTRRFPDGKAGSIRRLRRFQQSLSEARTDAPAHRKRPVTDSLSFPQPHIRQIWKIPEHRANVTEVHMVVHHGTYLYAPRHFIADGPTMDQVPLDRLYGSGVIWRFDTADDGVIDVADLERATPRMRPGDIVLIDSGHARYVNTDRYMRHACLTGEAARRRAGRQDRRCRFRNARSRRRTARAGFCLSGALHVAQPGR